MTEVDYQLAILLQHKFEQEKKDSQLAKILQEQEELEAKKKSEAAKTDLNDSLIAKSLQDQFQAELALERPSQNLVYDGSSTSNPLNSSKCLTDPSWEVIDPTPDIHNLFMAFNERFFWNKLGSVCVYWSKRMTTCAGICSYQGLGGMCTISLSEPLLKLRPRKDLVETLLHEMIHAYLFVTHNNRDRDGHGPEFHKHMWRINKEAGTNITVYHDFHDEVRLYQQHWWRCNGPCQQWKPYFGMVRRAMNRAPGPNDRWWAQHSQRCGGTFIKVKEPEKTEKPAKSKPVPEAVAKTPDIRKFFPTQNLDKKSADNVKTITNSNQTSAVNKVVPSSSNIYGFTNLNSDSVKKPKGGTSLRNNASTVVITKKTNTVTKGDKNNTQILNTTRTKSEPASALQLEKSLENPDYSIVRNHWINKFANADKSTPRRNLEIPPSTASKNCSKSLSSETQNPLKRASIDSSFESPPKTPKLSESLVKCPLCPGKFSEQQINAHLDQCLKTDFKDCDICGTSVFADNFDEHRKECIADLSKDEVFEISDDADSSFSKDKSLNESTDKLCDVCQKSVPISSYYDHINRCLHGMFDKIEEDLVGKRSNKDDKNECESEVQCLACNKKILKSELSDHLEDCMNLSNIFENENEPAEGERVEASLFNCPACMKLVSESEMNDHIDVCLDIVNKGQT